MYQRQFKHVGDIISKKREVLNAQLEEARKKLQPKSWKELNETEFSPNVWLIERLVPLEGITLITGAPASYKSWLVHQMATDISQGKPFLNTFASQKQGVLIVDEENHERLLQKHFRNLKAPTDAKIEILSHKEFVVTDENMRAVLLEICEKSSIGVIIFDSLIRISRSDENDARSMDTVFSAFKRFCIAKITVIIIHHERKEGFQRSAPMNRTRGSSNIGAQIDSQLSITKDRTDQRRLFVDHAKSREEEGLPSFEIAVQSEEGRVWFEYRGTQPINKSKASEAASVIPSLLSEFPEGLSKNQVVAEVRKSFDVGDKNVRKALEELIQSGVIGTKKAAKNTTVCFVAQPDSNGQVDENLGL